MIDCVNMRGIDLNLLTVLHAVLEEGHVSRAAARLGMSQPAVSAALERCRRLFGDPLLERSGNAMRPTARARALRQPLTELMERSAALITREPPPLCDVRQAVRIVVADALVAVLGCDLVVAVAAAAPGIDLILHPWRSGADGVDQLARGTADLAVSVLPPLDPAVFGVEPLFGERYIVAMRSGHPAAESFDLDGWLAWPHVVVSSNGGARTPVDRALAAIGRTRRVAVVVPSFLLAADLVRGSDLLALLPTRMRTPALERRAPPIPIDGFDLSVAWHRRREHDVAVRYVVDQLGRLISADG